MRGKFLFWTSAALLASALTWSSAAAHAVEGTTGNCVDEHFGRWVRATGQETISVAPNEVSTLHITAARNGGLRVLGWTGDQYQVTLCKAAGGTSDAAARQLLGQIKLVREGDQLRVEGPAAEKWSANLVVRAPKASNMEASAQNGPISVEAFSGTLRARTVNGPLSFEHCSGQMRGEAMNGPISLSGSGGDVNLSATNGPIEIRVGSNSWEGGHVDAHTTNGPLMLAVPAGFQTGFKVTSQQYSPMECNGSVCSQVRRTWNNQSRSIEYGGTPVLNMSTVNGPVDVQGPEE